MAQQTAQEKQDRALRLRCEGLSFAEISDRLGYGNRGTCHRGVAAALRRLRPKADRNSVHALECLRAERLWEEVFKAGEANLRLDPLVEPRSFLPKRLALVALTIAYVYLIQWGGFTLTSLAFLSLAMLLLSGGRNKRLIFVLSTVLALTGYLLFILAFETRFPEGPFELLMEQVL